MRKLGLLMMPLMTISLLANCKNNSFVITWKNWNGDVLETDTNVAKGTIPSYDHDEPTREKDREYAYKFTGWDKDITVGVTANTTFIAQYNPTLINYTAKFIKEGQADIEISFNANHLGITAPEISNPIDYYTYNWVSKEPVKSIGSKETITFTKDELHDWVFEVGKIPNEYKITFKKGGQKDVVRTVAADNLTFTAPELINIPDHYDGWWVCNSWPTGTSPLKLNAKESYTLDINKGELGNHTFTYAEGLTQYEIKFNGTESQYIDLNNLKIKTPVHTLTPHKDGCWKDASGLVLDANIDYTFTMDQLSEHTFTWTETDHQYKVTFNYADGTTPSVVRNISLSSLKLIAPETKIAPRKGRRSAWKSSNLIIESGGSQTFTKDELNEYVFTETEIENEYTITYVLGDESAVNPEGNPITYKVSDTVTLLPPTLSGFTFEGWYLGENEYNKFQYQNGWEPENMTGNITLYADWHIEGKTLNNDYDWSEISEISSGGKASKYFNIGETKNVIISNTTYPIRIIDFNKDNLSSDQSKQAGITFEFANLIAGVTVYWNIKDGENSTSYDFIHRSTLNECLQPGGFIYKLIPSSLMSVIKEVNKKVIVHPEDKWIEGNYDTKLFPLSDNEIAGGYQYYKGASSDKRKKGTPGDDATNYWLRSPYIEFGHGDAGGQIDWDGNLSCFLVYFYMLPVAPAFCI